MVQNVNINEYDEAMGGSSVIKNQMLGRRIAEPHVAKKQRKLESKVDDDEDEINESVIDTLPKNQQVNAKKIMRVLRSHGGDLVSWTADGDVSI